MWQQQEKQQKADALWRREAAETGCWKLFALLKCQMFTFDLPANSCSQSGSMLLLIGSNGVYDLYKSAK